MCWPSRAGGFSSTRRQGWLTCHISDQGNGCLQRRPWRLLHGTAVSNSSRAEFLQDCPSVGFATRAWGYLTGLQNQCLLMVIIVWSVVPKPPQQERGARETCGCPLWPSPCRPRMDRSHRCMATSNARCRTEAWRHPSNRQRNWIHAGTNYLHMLAQSERPSSQCRGIYIYWMTTKTVAVTLL